MEGNLFGFQEVAAVLIQREGPISRGEAILWPKYPPLVGTSTVSKRKSRRFIIQPPPFLDLCTRSDKFIFFWLGGFRLLWYLVQSGGPLNCLPHATVGRGETEEDAAQQQATEKKKNLVEIRMTSRGLEADISGV
jgi:hypothetical protein